MFAVVWLTTAVAAAHQAGDNLGIGWPEKSAPAFPVIKSRETNFSRQGCRAALISRQS